MSKIDEFKDFVKTKPTLVSFVKNGDMTWQKFYELWFLYGPDHDLWNTYKATTDKPNTEGSSSTSGVDGSKKASDTNPDKSSTKQDNFGLNELFNMVKKLDMNTVRNNITGIQKAIGLFQEMTSKGSVADKVVDAKAPYTPRPIYRRFED